MSNFLNFRKLLVAEGLFATERLKPVLADACQDVELHVAEGLFATERLKPF